MPHSILLVDDHKIMRDGIKTILERTTDFRIVGEADNGSDAIAQSKKLRPDLILMDIVMPGVNGFQATRELANDPTTRSIPVIMVTSKAQESDRVWGLRQGAVDYLVKPVATDQLVRKAQAALAG